VTSLWLSRLFFVGNGLFLIPYKSPSRRFSFLSEEGLNFQGCWQASHLHVPITISDRQVKSPFRLLCQGEWTAVAAVHLDRLSAHAVTTYKKQQSCLRLSNIKQTRLSIFSDPKKDKRIQSSQIMHPSTSSATLIC
jgi:hypothetical protein